MDAVDVRIFCEMGFQYLDYRGKDRHSSAREIGKKLGLDEKTVRLRIRKMEEEDVIKYYQAIPNPSLFNQLFTSLGLFQASNITSKKQSLQKLKQADCIMDIIDYLGETFGCGVAASSEADGHNRIRRLADLNEGLRCISLVSTLNPTSRVSLTRLDWQLIKALRYDATRPTQEIASELGITYRMTNYRISKLLESQAIFIRAICNTKNMKGIFLYSLYLSVEKQQRERVTRDLSEAYQKRILNVFTPTGPFVMFNLFATSIGEAEEALFDALSHPGIHSGSLLIFNGIVEPERPSWIDKTVDEKIAAR